MIGITLDIVLACGSTFQGSTGWQAGNILGTSGVSNGMGTGSSVFELFDVGLRLDPDATGVYGQYEVGGVHPVYRSERYAIALDNYNLGRTLNATVLYDGSVQFPIALCKPPTLAAGSSFAVNGGSAGVPSLQPASAGFGLTTLSCVLQNAASNWTGSVSVAFSGKFLARLS